MVQDALYLRGYAQALAAVASRAPDTAGIEMFARHAADVVAVERTLHDSLLAGLGIDPASIEVAEAAPTTLAYTSYLLATVRGGSYAEGAGAVLPCYWIYWEVGKELLRRGSPTRATSNGSTPTVARNSAMSSARCWPSPTGWDPASRRPSARSVHRHFRTTSRYEWMFWDMGYRRETWPVLVPRSPVAVCGRRIETHHDHGGPTG